MAQRPVLIVGAGMAGYAVARELKQRGFPRDVRLLTADGGAFYAKPLLSHALSRSRPALSQVTPADKAGAQFAVTVVPNARVTHVDLAAQVVTTEDGVQHPYGQLVVATGAVPVAPWQGPSVFSVNSAEDLARIEPRLQAASRVLVAGAGFVGLEFANDWTKASKQVTVVSPVRPLGALVPEPVSAWLQERLEHVGVAFERGVLNLAERPSEVLASVDGRALAEPFDLVLSAAGLRAEIGLWQQAGLAVGKNGVVVNDRFETSQPGVFAVGDVAQFEGRAWRFVAALNHAAKAVAAQLCGEPADSGYPAMTVGLKCPDAPLSLMLPHDENPVDWTVDEATPTSLVLRARQAGAPAGFVLGGVATGQRRELEGWLVQGRLNRVG